MPDPCTSATCSASPPSSASARGKSVWSRLGPARWLAIAWATLPAIAGITLLGSIGVVSDWLLARPEVGLTIYIAVFVLSAGLGLLPTYAQAILGGWVFGFAYGWPAALAGFTGAALVGYLVARTVSRDRVERVVADNPKAHAIRDSLVGGGFWRTLGIVTLLRVPPNSPFALTNLAMASTGVAVAPFAIGTLLGMAPRTAAAIYLGAAGAAEGARDIQDLAANGTGWGFKLATFAAMLVVLAIVSAIAKRALARINAACTTTPPPAPARDEADAAAATAAARP